MAEQTTSKKTVVIAVNLSENSKHAFEWYMKNLHRSDDHLILFYCQEPLEEPADPYSSHSPEWSKKIKKHEKNQKDLIEWYTKKCEEFSQSAKIKIESHHRPGERICAFAKQEKATYLVLGKRSLSSIRRTLIGGVSDHVVAHSTDIPVVVVPEQAHHH